MVLIIEFFILFFIVLVILIFLLRGLFKILLRCFKFVFNFCKLLVKLINLFRGFKKLEVIVWNVINILIFMFFVIIVKFFKIKIIVEERVFKNVGKRVKIWVWIFNFCFLFIIWEYIFKIWENI